MPRRLVLAPLRTSVSRTARRLVIAAGLAAAVATPGALRAQGALGTQGFGYPTGGLSTRALGTGGGLAEFDPVSPLNPATLGTIGRIMLSFQYDPEFRTVDTGARTQRATIARFPVVAVGIPIGQRFAAGISASTLLDRSFVTEYQTTSRIGDQTVTANERVESRGSIGDVRIGGAAQATRWLRVGVAAHLLTGENRLVSGRSFADTTRFGTVSDTTSLDYSGTAASAGVEVTPLRGVSVAGSYRRGGAMRVQRGDTTLTRGDAPDRMGVGLRVDRITGASFAASWARTTWSNMRSLADPISGGGQVARRALDVQDTDELMLGVEAVGPRIGDNVVLLRLGGRQRDLPFGIAGTYARERAYSAGVGLPFVGGRALADLAVQRATRTPQEATAGSDLAGVRERAWTLSVGFTVRP